MAILFTTAPVAGNQFLVSEELADLSSQESNANLASSVCTRVRQCRQKYCCSALTTNCTGSDLHRRWSFSPHNHPHPCIHRSSHRSSHYPPNRCCDTDYQCPTAVLRTNCQATQSSTVCHRLGTRCSSAKQP